MRKYVFLIVGALIIFALDQWTKVWAVDALVGGFDAINFIDGKVIFMT